MQKYVMKMQKVVISDDNEIDNTRKTLYVRGQQSESGTLIMTSDIRNADSSDDKKLVEYNVQLLKKHYGFYFELEAIEEDEW